MRPCLSLVAVILTVLGPSQTLWANPITYDFTGTLNQPIDGVTTFSGSFTIDATPTPRPGYSWITENGPDVSLSVSLGGRFSTFANSPSDPHTDAIFQAFIEPPSSYPAALGFGVLGWNAGVGGGGLLRGFGLTLYSYGVDKLPVDLASVELPLTTSSVDVTAWSGERAEGEVTSLHIVSTPEPSTWIIFAELGIAVLVHQPRRFSDEADG